MVKANDSFTLREKTKGPTRKCRNETEWNHAVCRVDFRVWDRESTDPTSTKQDLLESELMSAWHKRWAALVRNDAKTYAAFLADDVLVPANGLLYDKKALLELALRFKETSGEPRDVQVRGYDDAAVMVYRTTVHYP